MTTQDRTCRSLNAVTTLQLYYYRVQSNNASSPILSVCLRLRPLLHQQRLCAQLQCFPLVPMQLRKRLCVTCMHVPPTPLLLHCYIFQFEAAHATTRNWWQPQDLVWCCPVPHTQQMGIIDPKNTPIRSVRNQSFRYVENVQSLTCAD